MKKINVALAIISLLSTAFGRINYELTASRNINSSIKTKACATSVKLSSLMPIFVNQDIVSFANIAGIIDSPGGISAINTSNLQLNLAIGLRQQMQSKLIYGVAFGCDIKKEANVEYYMLQITPSFNLSWQNTNLTINGYVPLSKKYSEKNQTNNTSERLSNYGVDASMWQKLIINGTEYPFWLKGSVFSYVDSNYFTQKVSQGTFGIKLGGIFEVNHNFDVHLMLELSAVDALNHAGKSKLSQGSTVKIFIKYHNLVDAKKYTHPTTMFTVLQRDKGPLGLIHEGN